MRVRYSIISVVLLINIYLFIIYSFNVYSFSQTPPVKEISVKIIKETPAGQPAIIFHPFTHGWSDPVMHYLHGQFQANFLTDLDNKTSLDSCEETISNSKTQNVFVIKSNRSGRKASILSDWLLKNGYSFSYKKEFQKQCGYDLLVQEYDTKN